ncbi:MAG: hypothetical protein GQ532_19160, partial [Methylomarinum sp.]|nr:hypothetical protein [Methylomarinum sp.]
ASGRLIVDGTAIDSPLENLALYQALLLATDSNEDGVLEVNVTYSGESGSGTYVFLVPTSSQMDLAASLLAAASDKTASLSVDRIVTASSFLDVNDELAVLVTDYTYAGAAATYGDTTVWINVQVAGLGTEDLADDIYKSVEVNLVTGATVIYDGQTITVPGVTFETVANTVDENSDGVLDPIDAADSNGIDGFTQAVDDALQVIEFVHDFGLE